MIRLRSAASVLVLLAAASAARAHEPIHGFGPNTLWKGGISASLTFEERSTSRLLERDHAVDDPSHARSRESALRLELLYGLTANVQLGAELEASYEDTLLHGARDEHDARFEGLELAVKWRFLKVNDIGSAWQMAVEVAAQAHGDGRGARPTVGLAVSHDSIHLYLWSDVRAAADVDSDSAPNVAGIFDADLAVGVHVLPVEYGAPDLVLLLESNSTLATARHDRRDASSGGFVQAISPGFLFFFGPWELKASVQVPVYEYARGTHFGRDLTGTLSVEFHY